jgi:hypothetical protein
MIRHQEIIQLTIAYTLAGAFVFTVVITCLSLVGWIRFADKKQQRKLFGCLIVEVVAVGVGFFSGFLKFDPAQVAQNLVEQGKEIRKMQENLQPRSLSAEQKTALLQHLKAAVDGGKATNYIVVASRLMDAESLAYGKEIAAIIEQSGWPKGFTEMSTHTFKGVAVFNNPASEKAEACQIVRDAFRRSGIPFSENYLDVRRTPIQQEHTVYIVVGTK